MAFCFGHSSLGDFAPGATVYLKFTTVTGTGAPSSWLTANTVRVYKDNSLTQSTAGVTIVVDFDGLVGLNHITINTGSDAGFYTAGSDFQVVIDDGDVAGVSIIGYAVAHFSLHHVAALRPTTAGLTLDVAATGEAGLDFANVKAATAPTTLTNITVPTVTTTGTATAVTTVNGVAAAERNAIADALLLRDQTLVAPPALNAKVPLNAIRALNCGPDVAAGVMTIKDESGAAAMTFTLTTDAAAIPITGAVSP